MFLVRPKRDGVYRTDLGAQRAADAFVGDPIPDQRLAPGRGAALLVQVGVVFIAEVFQRRQDRVGRRLAQSAETGSLDPICQFFQRFQVARLSFTLAEAIEDLQHPLGADSAERAFAARFRLRELQKEAGHVHHAVTVVEDHHAAGTHDGAGLGQRFIIDRRVGERRRNAPAGRTAHLHRFEGASVLDTAADFLDDLANRDAHRDFDEPAAPHLARQCEDLGPFARQGAQRRKRFRAVTDDPRDTGQRLDVVHVGRLTVDPLLGGEGRPQARHSPLPGDRSDQRRLFSTHERAGAFPDFQLQVEIAPENAPAEKASRLRLSDGLANMPNGQRILRANVEIALASPDRVGCDRQALQHAVWVGLQHQPVHEGAGITFVAVADHVLGQSGSAGSIGLCPAERPLQPGRETRTAAAAQPGLLDHLHHVIGRAVFHAPLECLIPVASQVLVNLQRIAPAAILQDDSLLLSEVRAGGPGCCVDPLPRRGLLRAVARKQLPQVARQPSCAGNDPPGPNVPRDDRPRKLGRNVAVQDLLTISAGDFDKRLSVTHAAAADRFHDAVGARFSGRCLERVTNGPGPAGDPAGSKPHPDFHATWIAHPLCSTR